MDPGKKDPKDVRIADIDRDGFPGNTPVPMSTCDILRLTNGKRYFLPRKHKSLAARVVYNLMFWRRLIINSPMASFEYILSRMPVHDIYLASDDSTSFGMAGVLIFGKENPKFKGFNGLFWEITLTD